MIQDVFVKYYKSFSLNIKQILTNRILILSAFVFFTISLKSQTNKFIIDTLLAKTKQYYKINYDSCLLYADSVINLSEEAFYKKGIYWGCYWKSKIYYKQAKYNDAIRYSFLSIKNAEPVNDTIVLAKAYSNAGLSYFNVNKFDSALICQKECLKYYLLTDNKRSIAIAYNNLGSVLINLGNYKEAILKFQKGIELFDEIDMKNGVASCLLNIGQIYNLMGNRNDTTQNNKALSYYNKALAIYKKSNNEFKIAQTYNSIGIEYDQKATIYSDIAKQNDTVNGVNTILQSDIYYQYAIENLTKGLKIYQKLNYTLGIAQITNNIGTIYMNQDKFNVALKYLNLSLDANMQSNNTKEIATNMLSIASCYLKMNKPKIALKYLNEGFKYVKIVDIPILYQNYYEEYAQVYKNLKKYGLAFKYHVYFTAVKDSLLKADNLTTINEVQALYKNEIKDKELQLAAEQLSKEKAITQKKQLQIYSITVFTLLLIAVTIYILISLRDKKRSNKILAEKNKYISRQQKEITDSITYASKIQSAVLPQKKYVDKIFKEYFILFKPQHIVSGDFFWVKEVNDLITIVVADCTGHGVPGAFMSMLGLSFLNEISNAKKIKSTGEILNELRKRVVNSLHQTGKEGEQKDGMDISIITWYREENYLEFSGANNPLYLIRNGKLTEYKGDKMPIGIHVKQDDFKTIRIPINRGDCVYLFSDGYADQFGGPKGKKYKYKTLKKLLLANSHLPMSNQKQILDKEIEKWKAYINPYDNKPYQQIDDILVFGIRF